MTEPNILQLRDLAEAGQLQFKERIADKGITHSANEFVITIPRKIDPVSNRPHYNKYKLKLYKKQQDIRNYCSIPRSRQEILRRACVSDHFYNRKKYIYDLVEAGVLERTITDKPNDPKQKYSRKQ